MALPRWLARRLPSPAPVLRALRAAGAGALFVLAHIRPGPLAGVIGLALLYTGLAHFDRHLALALVGALLFADALHDRTPPAAAS